MNDRYRKFKHSYSLTHFEKRIFRETEFDFDERLFGSFVICDPSWYTEIPLNCKVDTFPISFRNGDYRADAVCDGFVDENGEVYISENEMSAGICIEWLINGGLSNV